MSELSTQSAPHRPARPLVRVCARLRAAIEGLGAPVLHFVGELGSLTLFCGQIVYWAVRRPFRSAELARHMRDVGFGSLFIVVLTGLFTGLVFGLQTLNGFRRFGAEALVGPATLLSLARELGPVLTGLMVAGRSGSGMA
ncbi:MAG: MlaE family ABC transporter permease, partial [Myxococcota bacterium]